MKDILIAIGIAVPICMLLLTIGYLTAKWPVIGTILLSCVLLASIASIVWQIREK